MVTKKRNVYNIFFILRIYCYTYTLLRLSSPNNTASAGKRSLNVFDGRAFFPYFFYAPKCRHQLPFAIVLSVVWLIDRLYQYIYNHIFYYNDVHARLGKFILSFPRSSILLFFSILYLVIKISFINSPGILHDFTTTQVLITYNTRIYTIQYIIIIFIYSLLQWYVCCASELYSSNCYRVVEW